MSHAPSRKSSPSFDSFPPKEPHHLFPIGVYRNLSESIRAYLKRVDTFRLIQIGSDKFRYPLTKIPRAPYHPLPTPYHLPPPPLRTFVPTSAHFPHTLPRTNAPTAASFATNPHTNRPIAAHPHKHTPILLTHFPEGVTPP